VVTDHTGNSIHGLRTADFKVSVAKAATFEAAEEVSPLRLNDFAEPIPVFILFDAISVPRLDQGKVAKLLLGMLREAADARLPVALLVNTGDGLRVVHDVGTDSAVLASALEQLSAAGRDPHLPAFTPEIGAEVERLHTLTQAFPAKEDYVWLRARQFGSLIKLGKTLQRSPGRKLLVWITGSFPLRVEGGQLTLQDVPEVAANRDECNNPHLSMQPIGTMNSAYAAATNAMNNARISVYPVQVGARLRTTSMRGDLCAPEAIQVTRLGLDEIAVTTGGRNLGILDAIDLSSTLADMRKRFDSYYLLTFTAQPNLKISWVNSKIRLDRADARVATPDGFFAGN
jgi:VWFA-related protein